LLERDSSREPSLRRNSLTNKVIFILGLCAAASGFISPAFALAIGLVFGLFLPQISQFHSRRSTKLLLQASVVALGFGMSLTEIVRVGRSGFVYTAISIVGAMIVGLVLGHLMRVTKTSSFLIAAGTAICGGSAIAAVGPIIEATEQEMAVSLSTIFVLNAVALFLFPPIGWALHLTQTQFGLWSALAIHDTSSVVGAATKYGVEALAVGTTVKLARALWIVPLSFVAMAVRRPEGDAKIHWPWFIPLFCLAAAARTYVPVFAPAYPWLSTLGKIGLTVTLYLIGTGLTRATLKEVGMRPLLQGILLWIVVAASSLALIFSGRFGLRN
jgi:uncharacterized integral membrane protein (TIGR00698 family)